MRAARAHLLESKATTIHATTGAILAILVRDSHACAVGVLRTLGVPVWCGLQRLEHQLDGRIALPAAGRDHRLEVAEGRERQDRLAKHRIDPAVHAPKALWIEPACEGSFAERPDGSVAIPQDPRQIAVNKPIQLGDDGIEHTAEPKSLMAGHRPLRTPRG